MFCNLYPIIEDLVLDLNFKSRYLVDILIGRYNTPMVVSPGISVLGAGTVTDQRLYKISQTGGFGPDTWAKLR
jgi:hypothetical protein